MRSRILVLLLALPPAVVLLCCLDWLTNWEKAADPVMSRSVTEREQYRPDAWSDEIIMQDETTIWYEDRVRERFPTEGCEERIEYILRGWRNLSACISEGVDSYVVPIPTAILYEKEGEEDRKRYRDFIDELSTELGQAGQVIDLYEALAEWKEEYIYYSETMAITNLGGYYATNGLLQAMGEGTLPDLEEYEEELYYGVSASEDEITYLYSLPGSRGYCELFTIHENGQIQSAKKPTIRRGGAGTGSVIAGGNHSWAVVEGDGEEEAGTLLLIGDESAKAMVPFLANHFHKVYYVFLNWDPWFGTRHHSIDKIFEEYDVRKVVLAQWASDIGNADKMAAFQGFCKLDGGKDFDRSVE